MRFYGFSAPEIAGATTGGMLDLAIDPKLAWALNRREQFPVDVNTADREMLLRVPGLGVKSIDRMIRVRRYRSLRLEDVARLCRGIDKVRPFITALDWTPGCLTDAADLRTRLAGEPKPVQLSLF
jgi:predicted DNA-binding helix-hairpin-helix protein